ncbi:bladder cancer-related protein BC10-domain-containing protein [Podospora appendiculata]|uniref:Bladder cancer-related protein BC10-domain-containing protein n=1 Tax=Podospora appendiculata TaxID=314037 RepID=A0AAE0X3B5_9PEZI|nr:bladder cancer-related protein BC10-domain-containing protein [Podospora appendiculata]
MFCLRSWLPLLFIPTNASPSFIFLFFLCTYFLNRPCVYCSFLLLILFLTSCNWSDRCFFDFGSNWFEPRPGGSFLYLPVPGWKDSDGTLTTTANLTATEDLNATATAVVAEMLNTTVGALATAATEQLARSRVEWTGLGLEWVRSLLGRREWRIDCLDLNIRL